MGVQNPTVAGAADSGNLIHPLRLDASGNLNVNLAAGTITGGNAAASATGAAVPASADYVGFNSGGNLVGVSSVNPLPITGSISATNPSVGTDGAATPTSSTAIGGSDGTNLQQALVESAAHPNLRVALYNGATEALVTAANALKIDGSAVTQPVSIAANVGVTQQTSPWVDNLTQVAGASLGATAIVNYGSTPAAAAVPGVNAFITNTPTVNVAASQTIAVTQATAANLNATVTGTVSVNALPTGSNTIGKVDILGNAGAAMDAAQNTAAPANALVAGGVFNTTIPAITAGNATQLQADSTGALLVNIEGRKKTYSAFVSFTPAAGDIALIPGNATTTVRITRVEVSLSTTGTAGIEAVSLVKRSAADTAGTPASMTVVPHDSNFAAANSTPVSYTTAPTPGAAVGSIRGVQFFDESSTVAGANTWLWEFGTRGGAAEIVLRGTAQELCINLGGAVATQTATVSFEWLEE